MNRSFILVFTLTCCVTAGCDLRLYFMDREAELENAFEVLLRHQFLRNKTFENYQPTFLTINGKDPSPDFLERFERAKIELKKGSEAGEEGVRLSIKSWEWIASDEIEIATSFNCGLECGGGARYVLVRKDERWTVKEEKDRWAE